MDNLGMSRNAEKKKHFFKSDPTARYLSDKLSIDPPEVRNPIRGSFGWLIRELKLDETSSFILALALLVGFDNAVGSIIAACLNDPAETYPNLALAQRLWDLPENILMFADQAHVLFRYGLLQHGGMTMHHSSSIDWEAPIFVPSLVANHLLFPEADLPEMLKPLESSHDEPERSPMNFTPAEIRLSSRNGDLLRIIPLLGTKGSAFRETGRRIGRIVDRAIVEFDWNPVSIERSDYLKSIAAYCWLRDMDLFMGPDLIDSLSQDKSGLVNHINPIRSIPINILLSISDRTQIKQITTNLMIPVIHIPKLSFDERVALWKEELGKKGNNLGKDISECSRRFRYEKETIKRIASGLNRLPRDLQEGDFNVACRNELEMDVDELAQKVTPRFNEENLILPKKQAKQFEEIVKSMTSLTEVHYEWGTAKVWNEGGISALFAGPSGTGKTMAAEVLSQRLNLPMYRIDLSQVVNKYIGETEKNLKTLFDAADISDMILFFDEADSLFGRRTEVKDAHDRYANLEISYLLERMERFKGLAILATNRKKDLDQAFLRRLRYIIDFPLPGEEQRRDIWRQVIPKSVYCPKVDIDFLARQFPLTGGHIRSIIFFACLQSANGQAKVPKGFKGRLEMEEVIKGVKREYDKLNRPIGLEQFEPYSMVIRKMNEKEKDY